MNKIVKVTKHNYSSFFYGVGMVMNVWSNKHTNYIAISKNKKESDKKIELSMYKDTRSISKDLRKAILHYER
ncbi:hypothetical protein P0E66_12600 [Enterococcus faecalis]|uniref:hypothetical protein n=1 Tax=Enterococcus faecalis TaxID=1351 RepID=UPI00051CD35E|nr:hypothetical protein [Enterococcus faecalis]KGJ37284.1 hypothetical protein ES21_00485 [Enterococcus faecalis]MDN3201966.1 hypothetical protein [Enterococcus faecalis]MEB7774823.1 hypothetical protein [Enterococcus faecalis]